MFTNKTGVVTVVRLVYKSSFIAVCILFVVSAQEPKYPFPQNVDYPYGVQSDVVDTDNIKSRYDAWRKKYIKGCNGNLMTTVDGSTVLVEAMGFGMMAAAYMGDKELVDGLWGFYNSKLIPGKCGMGWRLSCGGTSGGTATDGDVDVAAGMLVAHWQWPTLGYDVKLRELLKNIKVLLVECSGVTALHPGCSGNSKPYGGCHETDISYYQPAFFRYFAKISGDNAWAKLADDANKVRDVAAHPVTGLVPDWQTVNGSRYTGSRLTVYRFDAIRTAFKTGLDYLWNGTPEVKAWCTKLTSWFYDNVGIKKIADGYSLDGKQESSNHNIAHMGSLAVCACSNTQEIVDAYTKEAASLNDNFWYGDYLGNLYLLAMSGNMWNPEIVAANTAIKNRTQNKEAGTSSISVIATSSRNLVVSGLLSGSQVCLTSLSGKRVATVTAFNNTIVIKKKPLVRGCYILHVENSTGAGYRRLITIQ